MINWVMRGAVLLWAALFAIIGLRGVFDPASYTESFGIIVEGAGTTTTRPDLSAFFLVSAGAAAIGALVPGWSRALLVPAALYGTALLGRLLGAAMGDVVNFAVVQAMIVEALSVGLMIGGWWVLSRSIAGDAAGGATDGIL